MDPLTRRTALVLGLTLFTSVKSLSSVRIPVISSKNVPYSQVVSSGAPFYDDWPDFFPPYEQIDTVLNFVEGVKYGFSSTPAPPIKTPQAVYPAYPHPVRIQSVSSVTGSSILKKYGESQDEEDEDSSEETTGKYVEEVKSEEESSEEEEEEDEEEDSDEEEMEAKIDDPEDPPETTTTPAPFSLNDIKVPFSFLRVEYMIGYAFLGLMYGLGFLVLFQSICVPVAKFFVFISYLWAMYFGIVEPITKTDAMQYIPPNK